MNNAARINRIDPPVSIIKVYKSFLADLQNNGFEGEMTTAYGQRTVASTDNSIYQRLPQAVVYPKSNSDVRCIAELAAQPAYRSVTLTPRGGGTGTNGQSLADGLVVDLSRHLTRILEIDVENRRVRVQAGVVKDQLNAALAEHGLFFAPELSTSNRATIGGMINTDASGQGSCTYGKTRDHVLELKCVLLGGETLIGRATNQQQVDELCAMPTRLGNAYRAAERVASEEADLIARVFPPLNRCLTGYDLAHLRDEDGSLNMNSLLCGSEGTLGFIVEATLNVLPIPKFSTLVNIGYAGFMDALRDAQALMKHKPLSIETVDSKVLTLAMKDVVWQSVSPYFPTTPGKEVHGINIVEFSDDDETALAEKIRAFEKHLARDASVERLGHTLATGEEAVKKVYSMRKRAVGLLGSLAGEARPQPFVEDTAVPPEHLANYISEFRELLDSYGLQYGMFGHVDAGVLHVRPALDMKDLKQAALIRPISDAVASLTQKYGGLLWGEHGKGVRSEYAPAFFGSLYPALQEIKGAFDPHNQLNPGKIATPAESVSGLLRIDQVPMRGQMDKQIDERVWKSYGAAMHCNGNGACYNFDPDDAMCPSWKATRDRVHSPKGRASLIREWLRLQSATGLDISAVERRGGSAVAEIFRWTRRRAASNVSGEDFSHEVYDAMAGCLACKSCASQCPVKVNVPEFRARFLSLYHTRYRRPLKDYLVGSLESTVPYIARIPRIYNVLMRQPVVNKLLAKYAGLVDSPLLSIFDWQRTLEQWNVEAASKYSIDRLSAEERMRSVILVQDAFTRYFETPVAAAWIELCARMGFRVLVAPFLPNGKPLQVQGFLRAFDRASKRNVDMLAELAKSGIPLVGLDPAMTLVYRQEYLKVEDQGQVPEVLLPQEWLEKNLISVSEIRDEKIYSLLAHCTEKTNVLTSVQSWQAVFSKLGLKLVAEATGCCGMSGTYGHEARNVATSKAIFEQSWGRAVDQSNKEFLATGYSCRSQVKRFRGRKLKHPIEILLQYFKDH